MKENRENSFDKDLLELKEYRGTGLSPNEILTLKASRMSEDDAWSLGLLVCRCARIATSINPLPGESVFVLRTEDNKIGSIKKPELIVEVKKERIREFVVRKREIVARLETDGSCDEVDLENMWGKSVFQSKREANLKWRTALQHHRKIVG